MTIDNVVSINFNDQMHCNVEYQIAVEVFNQFEDSIQVSVDLSEAKKYFNFSEKTIEFPPIKKKQKLRRYISMKPLYEGTLTFPIKIMSNNTQQTQEITVITREPGEKIDGNRYENHIKTLEAKSTITWDKIGGLDEMKNTLMRNVILSTLELPEAIQPFRGILLYGPPGTGKSLLSSAAAGSLNATFFSLSVSDIMSYWYGENSRILQSLYIEARKRSPSIVFIDELDSIAPTRTNLYEGSRRLLSTLLSELSGFKTGNDRYVLTIAATNSPWDIDDAVLSRFPLKIYVSLPDEKACEQILVIHLNGLEYDLSLPELANECFKNHYSGRDIEALCRQAIWEMLVDRNPFLNKLETTKKRNVQLRPLLMDDFKKALSKIIPRMNLVMLERYEQFNKIAQENSVIRLEGYQ